MKLEIVLSKRMIEMYKNYFKRISDFVLSLMALIVLSPLLIMLMLIGVFTMKGNPFFCQKNKKNTNPRIYILSVSLADRRTISVSENTES